MTAMHDFPDSAADQPVLDALLAPLSPEPPCGPAARYDPVFTAIRLLREEDDPSLPMGQWERPLTCADWPEIERLCVDMLRLRSKDLQIAVWLVESWMRQRGFAGLMQGLRLLDALLQRYWPQLHPLIDGDDADARLAALEWLNESLSTSVRLHAVLLTFDGGKPVPMTLAEWERMTAQEMAPHAPAGDRPPGAAAQFSRADVHAASEHIRPALLATGAAVGDCLDSLQSIIAFLHHQLGDESPNLGKLEGTLEAILRVLSQLRPGQPADAASDGTLPVDAVCAEVTVGLASAGSASAVVPGIAVETGRWRNRAEAYATLEALADYLSEVEPHSPSPFLIRRAVNWGRMSLPEVIAEIIREEGDVGRLLNVLGIKL
ncbi:type VI secretion system protein TssA [Massilia sp. CMS3.1]|uniref:type VI secretion system protein TssA n=1 Tax=Massilia sp. CMS3.1 TaxID=3373083 RepID=UPI003EE53639